MPAPDFSSITNDELFRIYNKAQPAPGLFQAAVQGGASSFLPIEAAPYLMKTDNQLFAREELLARSSKDASLLSKVKPSFWERNSTPLMRRGATVIGRTASKWFGPAIMTYRMATELPKEQSIGAGASKAVRIVGEEVAWGAGSGIGLALGAKAGAAIGTVVAPGVGTVAGLVIGAGLGYVFGAVGAEGWNKVVDVAETPFRAANAFVDHLRRTGKQSSRLELGGRVSLGNSTRLAYTMRQRALQDMNRSGINARRLLGNEAALMHLR